MRTRRIIFLALKDREFGSYWFDSGTPTYLTDLFAGPSKTSTTEL